MATQSTEIKNQFVTKFLEFQLYGLQQYGKYLDQQYKMYKKKDVSGPYTKYIDKEIIRNNKKILSVKEKMG